MPCEESDNKSRKSGYIQCEKKNLAPSRNDKKHIEGKSEIRCSGMALVAVRQYPDHTFALNLVRVLANFASIHRMRSLTR
jgi:hypothetical protein